MEYRYFEINLFNLKCVQYLNFTVNKFRGSNKFFIKTNKLPYESHGSKLHNSDICPLSSCANLVQFRVKFFR